MPVTHPPSTRCKHCGRRLRVHGGRPNRTGFCTLCQRNVSRYHADAEFRKSLLIRRTRHFHRERPAILAIKKQRRTGIWIDALKPVDRRQLYAAYLFHTGARRLTPFPHGGKTWAVVDWTPAGARQGQDTDADGVEWVETFTLNEVVEGGTVLDKAGKGWALVEGARLAVRVRIDG